jgi:nucleoside-diphosphate-sugar epimerase
MRILVTGASGFLGSECARQLRHAGHDVTTTDLRPGSDRLVDLSDEAAVERLPDVDTVVHCAAVQYVSPDLPWLARQAYFRRNNVIATRRLARRYASGATHFVNVGSSMMYEQTGAGRYDESSPCRPQGVYTASKIEAQRLVDALPNPSACVIPCIIAGPGRGGLFASIVGMMRKWGVAMWPGPGRHRIHVVHVTDAAAVIRHVVEQRATGRFNAASADPLSIVEWVDEMAAALDLATIRRITLPLGPIASAAAISRYRLLAREQILMLRFPHVLDTARSRALGWTPAYTNAAIMRETAIALARPAAETGGRRAG